MRGFSNPLVVAQPTGAFALFVKIDGLVEGILVQEIASAGTTQSRGGTRINTVKAQVSQSTQTDQSSGEAFAATSVGLSSQSPQQKQSMAVFRLEEHLPAVTPAPTLEVHRVAPRFRSLRRGSAYKEPGKRSRSPDRTSNTSSSF